MLKLRNNWENYEWTLNGEIVDPREVSGLVLSDGVVLEAVGVRVTNTVSDHGLSYHQETWDILVSSYIEGGIPVSIMVSDSAAIRNRVVEVE